jgi:hypothetical protein
MLRRFHVYLDQEGGTQPQDVKIWMPDGTLIGHNAFRARETYGEDIVRPAQHSTVRGGGADARPDLYTPRRSAEGASAGGDEGGRRGNAL